jgi:hypothetical protein
LWGRQLFGSRGYWVAGFVGPSNCMGVTVDWGQFFKLRARTFVIELPLRFLIYYVLFQSFKLLHLGLCLVLSDYSPFVQVGLTRSNGGKLTVSD